MPSRRIGTEMSSRNFPKSIREASEKSTSASVASARARTVELVLEMSIPSRTWDPTRRPIETNMIASVSGVPETRFDTAATAIRTKDTIASAQSIQIDLHLRSGSSLREADSRFNLRATYSTGTQDAAHGERPTRHGLSSE